MSCVDLDDTSVQHRVADLIERGLERYGQGDFEGALGFWKHALALDEQNWQARDYVGYLERHFAVSDAGGASRRLVAPAELEHEVPYGLTTLAPISEAGIDAYESFELARGPASQAPCPDDEFSERVPTRVNQLATEVDQGWSLGTGEFPRHVDQEGLENELAAVAEGLEIAESGAVAAPRPEPDLGPELELATPRKTEPRATALGYQRPRPPAFYEDLGGDPMAEAVGPGPASLELELELGEPLEPLEPAFEIDIEAEPALEIEAEPAFEIEAEPAFEIEAEPALEIEAEPGVGFEEYPPFELDDSVDLEPPAQSLELELGKAGGVGAAAGLELDIDESGSPRPRKEYADVDIDFREPAGLEAHAPRAAAAAPTLEDQLAELEAELGSSDGVPPGWRPHDDGGATLEPLPPRARRPEPPPPTAPGPRVDAAALSDQILTEVEAAATPGAGGDEAVRRRIGGLIDRAELESRRGDLAAAAVAADLALAESPDSAVAQKLLHQRSDPLVNAFRRFLGDLACTPVVALPMHELPLQELDHRAAFLLSRIDGTLSFEDILDVSGMPRLEALRYLCRLRLQGIVEVR